MKELKRPNDQPIINTHYPVRKYKPKKYWTYAETKSQYRQKLNHNQCVEAAYHRVIKYIRQNHFKQVEIFFNLDHKNGDDGPCGMHSFVTSSFYWRLDCSPLCDYEITFAFNNCVYEEVIRKMMLNYPLDRVATLREMQPDYDTFFKAVIDIQIAEYNMGVE